MAEAQILLLFADPKVGDILVHLLKSSGYHIIHCNDRSAALRVVEKRKFDLLLMSDKLQDDSSWLDFCTEVLERVPAAPIVVFFHQEDPRQISRGLRLGIYDYLTLPLRSEEILRVIKNSLERSRRLCQWVLANATYGQPRAPIAEVEALARLGRSITHHLELDSVLVAIVDAAVELTQAEEGSLMLVEESSGSLYMRASRNFNDEFAKTFRLPVSDSLAGYVLESGEPYFLETDKPQKIKTSYLVHSLIYVPLEINSKRIGILAVDHRTLQKSFTQNDVSVLCALAEFAATALENARLYAISQVERDKANAILSNLLDGVIVVDPGKKITFVNQTARLLFGLPGHTTPGKPFSESFPQPELQRLVKTGLGGQSSHAELRLENGSTYDAREAPVPGVGVAIILHDITHLKQLDTIKGDFIHSISHDLRTPLTSILGYVDLIERGGPVTEMQADFIHRARSSVIYITRLMENLITLGRIESGMRAPYELLSLNQAVFNVTNGFADKIKTQGIQLEMQLADGSPKIKANLPYMTQMITQLVDNAVRFTPPGGSLTVATLLTGEQALLCIRDSGPSILSSDLPRVFERFYRARGSNEEEESDPDRGLGLAIVKAIVESHGGRVWVDSNLIEGGASFNVMLPSSG